MLLGVMQAWQCMHVHVCVWVCVHTQLAQVCSPPGAQGSSISYSQHVLLATCNLADPVSIKSLYSARVQLGLMPFVTQLTAVIAASCPQLGISCMHEQDSEHELHKEEIDMQLGLMLFHL